MQNKKMSILRIANYAFIIITIVGSLSISIDFIQRCIGTWTGGYEYDNGKILHTICTWTCRFSLGLWLLLLLFIGIIKIKTKFHDSTVKYWLLVIVSSICFLSTFSIIYIVNGSTLFTQNLSRFRYVDEPAFYSVSPLQPIEWLLYYVLQGIQMTSIVGVILCFLSITFMCVKIVNKNVKTHNESKSRTTVVHEIG